MTWIIGTPTRFGYALGISDIQVTLSDRSTFDCLQKIYAVGPDLAMGFSGSVKIGFGMVDKFTRLLRTDQVNAAWVPTAVVKNCQVAAQEAFRSYSRSEQSLGCHLMILGAHPTKRKDEFAVRTEVFRFRSPDFKPSRARPFQVVSVGSGNRIVKCKRALRGISNGIDSYIRGEALHPGGMADVLVDSISDVLEDAPTKGISSHLHICLVRSGDIKLGKNDRYYINEPNVQDRVMPSVASSYSEFLSRIRRRGLTAECASC